MKLFARDRSSGRLAVPGMEGQWMVFQGLPGRKLARAQYASLDAAIEATGGPERFKERTALFTNTDSGRKSVRARAKEDPDSVVEQYDPTTLVAMSCTEWSFEEEISEENVDELPHSVREWARWQILEMEGIVGPRADQGNA